MSINSLLKSPLGLALASLALLFALALTGIALERPTGNIAGQISLEQSDFGLQSYDMRDNKVYAMAVGPIGAGRQTIERGVWVNRDGSFRINHLPVGEYQLKVRATGFATARQSGVFVDDARTTTLKPVAMYILEPSVNIAASSRVFTTRQAPAFWINATGGTEATVKVYRTDLLSLLRSAGRDNPLEFSGTLSLYKPWKLKTPMFQDEKPIQTLTRKLVSDEEDWARSDMRLDGPLPPGDYLATVEVRNLKGQTDWNLMWFNVSDLGLIVKQAPEKTLVRAIDLNTLQPVPGVDVSLLDKSNAALGSLGTAKTDANGFASFALPAGLKGENYYNLLALGSHGTHRAYGGIDYWSGTTDRYQTYFYTERPIYRLGQTVYFKGISRILTGDGFASPKTGTAVTVTVEDPDNNKLWSQSLTLNSRGTFNGLYQIPADGKTGAYQVTIGYPDGTSDYQRFEVAQYRKPEYQVEVIPTQPRTVAGSKVKARVRATYFFGAPVAHARVKYTIYEATDWSGRYALMDRPDYYGYFDDWANEDAYDRGYAGSYVAEGYAQTDETGEALIEFDTPAVSLPQDEPYSADYMDRRYTIQAEVTDLSRLSVVGSGTATVTAGDFVLFLEPDRYVVRNGDAIEAWVRAVDYEGKPITGKTVEVALRRWKWDSVTNEYRGFSTEGTQSLTTDGEGRGRLKLKTAPGLPSDSYFLSALARDGQGRPIFDQTSLWLANPRSPYVRDGEAARQEAFSVKADKAAYQPGDTARIMITAPLTGKERAQVLVGIEGLKLHETRVIPMDATAKLVEIPIRSEYAPNVYVAATLVGPKHQYYHQETMLKVSPEAHFLNLTVSTDKAKYHPGDTAVYTVKAVKSDGTPAAGAELSLGVVDESIYAIRPEAARDIRKFFYPQRPNLVSTLSSFPEEYSGGPDKIEPRVRKDFRDVAEWIPTMVTDKNGIATARVKLPDNLTTWRATVRAIQDEATVGSTIQKVVSTQDILVRLALPRFFTQYDEGSVTAIVHNYSDQTQDIRLALDMSPQLSTRQTLTQQLKLEPEEAKRYTWPVTADTPGEATLLIKAIGQSGGDAMEMKLPVRALGIQAARIISHFTDRTDDTLTLPLRLPHGVDPAGVRVWLSLAASTVGPVLGSFDTLIDYPYGCTEQTMSRLMPAIIAHRIGSELGVAMPQASRKRFEDVYLKGMARLKDYRHADGGWGWWQYDDSDAYLTAYVMEGIYWLERSGKQPALSSDGTDWKADGLRWLSEASNKLATQLADPKLANNKWTYADSVIDLAYMQYVLALYGKEMPAKARRYLLSFKAGTPPEALAYQTLAFSKSGDSRAAQRSLQALNRLAGQSGTLIHWDHTRALQKKLGYPATDYTYRFTGVESTALALRASVAAGASPSRLEGIKQWLVLQRNRDGWENTKTTAQVLWALTEEALANETGRATDFSALSELWGDPVRFDRDNRYGPERVFEWTAKQLGQGITLRKKGEGRLYYRMLATFITPLKPGDTVKEASMPAGLKVSRSFYRIEARPTANGSQLRLKAASSPTHEVRAGETLLMRIEVDSPVALPYVIIDAALPSGGEVLSEDPRTHQVEEDAQDEFIYDWGNWWWSHQDVLDDRLVLFARALPAGKSEFQALVRLELPGRFQMNPVSLQGMYSGHVRAVSSLDSIRVAE